MAVLELTWGLWGWGGGSSGLGWVSPLTRGFCLLSAGRVGCHLSSRRTAWCYYHSEEENFQS